MQTRWPARRGLQPSAARSEAPQGRDPQVSPPSRRRARWTLIIAGLFVVLAGAIGSTTPGELVGGGMVDTSAEASQSTYLLEDQFPASRPNVVIVVTSPTTADDISDLGLDLTKRLSQTPEMIYAQSYWGTGDSRLRSQDGRSAMILAVSAVEPDILRSEVDKLAAVAAAQGAQLKLGGFVETNRAIEERTAQDLLRTELVAIPLLLLVLLLAFRGLRPALLPLGLGLLAVTGSLLVLRVLTIFTPVSVFSLNVCTALGLGLAVDYSLLIISRFREELRLGRTVDEAVATTRATAGRTVIFSAAIVALCLSALLVFPQYFIRSFAYAGIAVVALTAVGSILVLPPALQLLGERVLHRSARTPAPRRAVGSRWYRFAGWTLRHRIAVLAGGTVILLALAAPVLGLRPSLPDDRQLPRATEATQTQELIRTQFVGWSGPVDVAVTGLPADQTRATAAMLGYAQQIARLSGVDWVDGAFGTVTSAGRQGPYETSVQQFAKSGQQWLSVGTSLDPNSTQARDLVRQIRALDSPATTLVGGPAADIVDTGTSVLRTVPLAALIIVVVAFLLLFWLTGGLLLPVKAVILNVLSLAATFGVLTWAFQQGHLRRLLGNFQVTGYLDYLALILVAGVAFALAMDYEVFLLSRVREEYLVSGDLSESIRRALHHTGGIITVAAALICVVFIGLATSAVFDLKVIGVGLFVGIILDATLVRCAMVPAFLSLAGKANWWAPRPLRALHARIDVRH